MRQYISIDADEKETSEEIHMINKDNQICGMIKSYNPETDQVEDVRQIFVQKEKIQNVQDVPNYSTKTYTLHEIADTLHNLIEKLNDLQN